MPTTAVRPGRGGADGGDALVEGSVGGLCLGGLAEDVAQLHELGLRLLEAAEFAVGLLVDDGRDAAQFGNLLHETAAHEDDVGFARHERLKVDFLGRAGIDDALVGLVLREPGKGRGLRDRDDAFAEPPCVHGVEDGEVENGDALGILRDGDFDGALRSSKVCTFRGSAAPAKAGRAAAATRSAQKVRESMVFMRLPIYKKDAGRTAPRLRKTERFENAQW